MVKIPIKMYNLFMKRVMFKDNFIDIKTEYLQELNIKFYTLLGSYDQKIKDIALYSKDDKKQTDIFHSINLIKSLMAKRSTIGTEELEGYTPDIKTIEKNLEENSISLDPQSNITLKFLKSYLNYEYPDLLTKESLSDLHKYLYQEEKETYKPGRFRRKGDPDVAIATSDKLFIESKFVDKELDKFILYINTMDEPVIVKAAVLHGILLGIHPFKDGNGRITRLLTDKFITKNVKVPLFISESINNRSDDTDYKRALDQFHLQLNSEPLIRFFYEVAINQLENNINLINEWQLSKMDIEKKLIKAGYPEKYSERTSSILSANNFIYQKEFAATLEVTTITASKLIECLLENRIITKEETKGRITFYKVKI